MQIIDTHPHVASHDTERYPITPLGDRRSDWSHERSVTTEELIAAMDEGGVAKAALVHSSTTYGFNCEYCADAIAAYPDRLTGVFSIDVFADDAVDTMKKWYDRGLTGLRIYVKGTTVKRQVLLDDDGIFPVYAYAGERGITVAVNINAADGFEPLENILRRFPGTRFFLDHTGRADFTGGAPFEAAKSLLRLSRYPNLYLKVTSVSFLKGKGWAAPGPILHWLVEEFGANKLAWGSNFPASDGTMKELVDLAMRGAADLSVSDRDWLFSKTALQLYPALAD